jgi:hypothetical protein
LAIAGPVPVNVRTQAHIGLAYVLERHAGGQGRSDVLERAVDELLKVFNGFYLREDEKADPYWRGQSGLIALRLLERLGNYDAACKICIEMEQDFPGMKTGLKIRRERLQRLKSGHQ